MKLPRLPGDLEDHETILGNDSALAVSAAAFMFCVVLCVRLGARAGGLSGWLLGAGTGVVAGLAASCILGEAYLAFHLRTKRRRNRGEDDLRE